MTIICPTVTDTLADPHEFRRQMNKIKHLSERIHIDLMDGKFAPSRSINPIQVWWPENIQADIHLMFQKPLEHIETLVSLKPHMVIIHAESEGDLLGMIAHLKQFDIKMGVALLKETEVKTAAKLIAEADHALLYSGNLGHFGGIADTNILIKSGQIRAIKPDIELGWDGGANLVNVSTIAKAGVNVINVGGVIQTAHNPDDIYATLVSNISNLQN